MQTIINAWKRRVAIKARNEAIATADRLSKEFVGYQRNPRPALLILAEMGDADRALIRANSTLRALDR